MASGHPGYIWTVYPQSSDDPMVSLGHTEQELAAREHVESELATVEHSAWGVVIGPGGRHDVCRRSGPKTYKWSPLFNES
jgi:hypothetical protein